MAFPSSPSNDDLHTEYGRTFKYSSATNSWSVATPDAPADTLPSSQAYVDVASLPLSGVVAGSTAFVQDGNKLFMFSGSGWFEIATINTAPTITSGADATYTLNSDGTPTVITLQATDPEGTPIVWGYQVTSGSLEDTTVTNEGGVFTVTPGATDATFNLTFTASDGVNIDTSASSFTLVFISSHRVDWSDAAPGKVSFGDGGGSGIYFNYLNLNGQDFTNDFVWPDGGTLNITYSNANTGQVYLEQAFKYYSKEYVTGFRNQLRFYGDYTDTSLNNFYSDVLNKNIFQTSLTGPYNVVNATITSVTDNWNGDTPGYAYIGKTDGFVSAGQGQSIVGMIDKFSFASNYNSVAHGELLNAGIRGSSFSSPTSGYLVGHATPYTPNNGRSIHKFQFASNTYGTVVAGQLPVNGGGTSGSGYTSWDYGYSSGGGVANANNQPHPTGYTTPIERFSFASEANTIAVGAMRVGPSAGLMSEGMSSRTHGYAVGMDRPTPEAYSKLIRKFAFGSSVTVTDTSSLTHNRYQSTNVSSSSNGYIMGSEKRPSVGDQTRSYVETFPFASEVVSASLRYLTRFSGEELYTNHVGAAAGFQSKDYGYMGGGQSTPNTSVWTNNIHRLAFASGANTTDGGNLTYSRGYAAGHQV
jgi:hypothetical protein